MSEEFIKAATQEINEEITGIQHILNYCKNNSDLSANAGEIQKHTHKIKGLAPMIDKEDLGLLSAMLDSILQKIMKGKQLDDLLKLFTMVITEMTASMTSSNYDLNKIKKHVSLISSDIS
jgi:chemotaxis protein histidine kinase CheA